MKIITEPTVYLVGRQEILDDQLLEFLEDHSVADHEVAKWVLGTIGAHTDAESLPEIAGRLCYMSFNNPRPGGNKAYLRHILEVGHGSVLEHSVWNFIFTGVSRSLTHELVRHRAGFGYSQLSQRFVDESAAEYVVPHDIKDNPVAFEMWKDAVSLAHNMYVTLVEQLIRPIMGNCPNCGTKSHRIEGAKYSCCLCQNMRLITTEQRKQARQAARSVLPNATETKIFVTMNARAARHTIELRCSRHAEPEIRKVFYKVWKILVTEAPNIFGDYKENPLPDGTIELVTEHRKV